MLRTAPAAGALLRRWRAVRGKSQLELSFDAGVSQRHISFVESGRSVPSRRLLMDLAEALDIPLRERNDLLLASGYAPLYPEPGLTAPVSARLDGALRRMLRQQEPYPALVLDRYWNVLMTNDAAPRLFGRFVDLASRPQPRNLLQLVVDPAGLRPHIVNWDEVARSLVARIRREAPGRVADPGTAALLASLPHDAAPADPLAPTVPITLRKDGLTLSYFSLVTTVGTPLAITAEELRIECMFPADDATEAAHAAP